MIGSRLHSMLPRRLGCETGRIGFTISWSTSRPERLGPFVRILILHSRYQSGPTSGENRVSADEAALLRSAGHEVILRLTDPEVSGPLELVRTGASTVWSRRAAEEVRALVRRHGIDVVHAHNLFPTNSPTVLRAAASEGAAVLLTLHNYRYFCLPANL